MKIYIYIRHEKFTVHWLRVRQNVLKSGFVIPFSIQWNRNKSNETLTLTLILTHLYATHIFSQLKWMKIKSQSIELNPNVRILVTIYNIWLSIYRVHFPPGVCVYLRTNVQHKYTHKMKSKQIEAIKSKAAQIAQTNTILGLTYADIFFFFFCFFHFFPSFHHLQFI